MESGSEPERALRSAHFAQMALRRLEEEYLQIASTGAGERPEPPCFRTGLPIRAGYRLLAEPGEPVRVEPSFACALAADLAIAERCRLFDHLWGVDYSLWTRLDTASSAELAETWKLSLGRRLVLDLTLLQRLHATSSTPLDLGALWAASGAEVSLERSGEVSKGRARWLDLHASLPGEAMARWVPKRGPNDVATALARLECGSPASLRGAAIGWLLTQAVRHRRVELAGVFQDLPEILPAHLALALQGETDNHEEQVPERFAARLEEATLRHAAWIMGRDPDPGRVRRAWHVARWIHGCLTRSPLTASNDERLHADLVALLPPEDPPLCEDDDPLHPARFGDEDGLRIEEVALVAGVWTHYGGQERCLLPTPTPLVRALRSLAVRPLRSGERDAEASFARSRSNELGWTAPHLAPPWVARWLLTEWHLPWLIAVDDTVIDECLEVVAADRRFEWLTYVWRSEGDALTEAQRSRSLGAWRALRHSKDASPQAIASMATALLRELDGPDQRDALAQLLRASAQWRPYLWDAWIEAALIHELRDLAQRGFEGLVALTDDVAEDRQARLNAALFLLRRAAALRGEELGALALAQLERIAPQPPFSEHRGLQRELRRLGVR